MKTYTFFQALKLTLLSTTLYAASTGIAQSDNTCTDTCDVTNQTTGTPFGSDLQGAINAAVSGQTLLIRGLCQGSFTITNIDLDLAGKSTDHCPEATLQNIIAAPTTTLTINATANTISLIDLVITGGTNSGIISNSTLNLKGITMVSGNAANGLNTRGGGIRDTSSTGSINMYNKSQVSGNTAQRGGGIFSSGTIRMYNATTVKDNIVTATATDVAFGGGILSLGVVEMHNQATVKNNNAVSSTIFGASGGGISSAGTITLYNSAAIINNSSATSGGGIFTQTLLASPASVTLNDNSTVSGNTSDFGGGILGDKSAVTLNDKAIVTANTATADGGGVYSAFLTAAAGSATVTLNNKARISKNSAGNQGGGVFNDTSSTLTMMRQSLIDENTAGVEGGGIFNLGTLSGAIEGVNVKNNTPDDIEP